MVNGFEPSSGAQCCETCNAFLLVDKQNGVGICRAKSPAVFLVGVQERQGPLGKVGEPITTSAFPQVQKDRWCREWGPRFTQ